MSSLFIGWWCCSGAGRGGWLDLLWALLTHPNGLAFVLIAGIGFALTIKFTAGALGF